MKVLGYNGNLQGYPADFGAGHDSSASIVVDGELVAACEEERFNREKHSCQFPKQAIDFCLQEAGARSLEEVDLITYYWDYPSIYAQNRQDWSPFWRTGTWAFLTTMRNFNKVAGYTNDKTLDQFERMTGYRPRPGQFQIVPHHMCHVASTFYDSPFSEALTVTMDALGEKSSSIIAHCKDTKIDVIKEVFWPHSMGYLYLFITDFLGFQPNNDEYKVMGLAPYGNREKYREFFKSMVTLGADGSYKLDADLMVQLTMTMDKNGVRYFPPGLTKHLGPTRKEHEPIEQRHMDIAASLQECLELTMIHQLKHLRASTGLKNLCLAGGVTLNCTMNGVVARSGLFDNVWIHTAAHDAGCSVGAALYGHHNILGQPRHFQKKSHRYLGPAHPRTSLESALVEFDAKITHTRPDDVATTVAQAMANGKVVGFYQGRMEWGPRALGNRSILADPRRDDMKDIVNHAVKLREGFRPFAPACLAEKATEWFDMTGLKDSPYMLFIVPVVEDKRAKIPAVTHVDGSARVQTVTAESNPRFHAVIKAFDKITGVPVVMNTSFNVKGEPIVNTPADAIRCFLGTQIDLLVLEDVVVEKRPEVAEALSKSRMKAEESGRVVDGRISAV